MSVKIRLRRDGGKKRPFYHVVAADERRARNGRFIEELGYYNPIVPRDAEARLVLKEDRVRYWLSVGAQPTDTAAALLKRVGILERTVRPGAAAAANTAATADATPASASADEEATPATSGDSDGPQA
jgi:small subunit ribosomal protein S16